MSIHPRQSLVREIQGTHLYRQQPQLMAGKRPHGGLRAHPDLLLKSLGDDTKEHIAGVVAEQIIDMFETVTMAFPQKVFSVN
jgi:hypothetical protein